MQLQIGVRTSHKFTTRKKYGIAPAVLLAAQHLAIDIFS